MKHDRTYVQVIVNILVVVALLTLAAQPTGVSFADTAALPAQGEGDGYVRETNPDTGKIRFLQLDVPAQLEEMKHSGASNIPLDRAGLERSMRLHLERYAPEFGVKNPTRDLRMMGFPVRQIGARYLVINKCITEFP